MAKIAHYINALAGIVFGMLASNLALANDEWYKCQTVSQCTIIKGNCGVEWAINKKFAEMSGQKPPRVVGPCKKPLEVHPANTFIICADSRCILYPSGTQAGGKSIESESCLIADCWGHFGCNYLTCTRGDGSKYTKYAQ